MCFPQHFGGLDNKYKKSVGNLPFYYIQIFKAIKTIKIKVFSHLGTNKLPTKCGFDRKLCMKTMKSHDKNKVVSLNSVIKCRGKKNGTQM